MQLNKNTSKNHDPHNHNPTHTSSASTSQDYFAHAHTDNSHELMIHALLQEVNLLKAQLQRKPYAQGWLFISIGLLLFIHVFIGIRFLNQIIVGVAIALFIAGAREVHLGERIKKNFNWIKHKLNRQHINKTIHLKK